MIPKLRSEVKLLIMNPARQYGLIWAGALFLTALSHLIMSTLTKSPDQSFQRFVLLLVQPTVGLVVNRIDLPVVVFQTLFYAQFPAYAIVLSFFVGTRRFGWILRCVLGFHILLVLGAVYLVIRDMQRGPG